MSIAGFRIGETSPAAVVLRAMLSKPLRYAEDVGLIAKAPKVGPFKIEPPEIVF